MKTEDWQNHITVDRKLSGDSSGSQNSSPQFINETLLQATQPLYCRNVNWKPGTKLSSYCPFYDPVMDYVNQMNKINFWT